MTNLDASFSALADPTRRAILARLALGETSVMELAKPFAMSLPAVSKHLKVLERAGLIARGREAQFRPCRIEPKALKGIDDWLENYRRFFEESFDRLDAYLKVLQAKSPKARPKKAKAEVRSSKKKPSRGARTKKCASSTKVALDEAVEAPFPSQIEPQLATLVADPAYDGVMVRYNAAHTGAEREIFPLALGRHLPVLAYTATRWGSLVAPDAAPPGEPAPRAALSARRFHVLGVARQLGDSSGV